MARSRRPSCGPCPTSPSRSPGRRLARRPARWAAWKAAARTALWRTPAVGGRPVPPLALGAPTTSILGAWATPRCASGRASTSRGASARAATRASSATARTRLGPCTSGGRTGRLWRRRPRRSASASCCPSSRGRCSRWAWPPTRSGCWRSSRAPGRAGPPLTPGARSRPGTCGPWRRPSEPCPCGRCWWCCRGRRGRRPHARRPCWTRCSRSCGRWATSSTSGRRSPETIEFGQALFATSSSMLGI
mmetsp:Transcript_127760/g.342870  ORF Transcript_127760/g.342870 Transcript_127760/m.342870 type:complete len:247 (-) Transcript_127760:193-933(-)